MKTKIFLVELTGTFALIFMGAGAAAVGVGGLVGVAMAHGFVVIGMAYAYGHISGTHINPAVTFAMLLSGTLSWTEAVYYWIAQFLGGTLAAAALFFILDGNSSGLGATVLADGTSPLQGFFIEMALTFFLVNAVLQTAVRGKAGNLAGLAIGLTLIACIQVGGPLTGASLNPARTFGPALFTGSLNLFWLYLSSTLVGATLAVGIDKILNAQ